MSTSAAATTTSATSGPLTIALDANPLLSTIRSGIPYYTESLAEALLAHAAANGGDLALYFTGASDAAALQQALAHRGLSVPDTRTVAYRSFYQVPERRSGEHRLLYAARTAPLRLEMKWRKSTQRPPKPGLRLDVFHHTDYLAHDWAGARCRHVSTVHDLIPLHFPDVCRPDWLWFAERAYAFARDRAEMIVTPSIASRNDIVERLNISADRVHVIPHGVRPTLLERLPDGFEDATLEQFGLRRRGYILSVGRLDPLKNLERLVQAFARAADHDSLRDVCLVLTGPRSNSSRDDGMRRIQDTLAQHGLTDRCIFTGFVADDQLSALMRGCLFFAFPSLIEGFGMPVLEAMAQGAAILTSNVSCLPEVAGDTAVLVDPYDVDAIADGLLRIAGHPAEADRMRQAARARAALFSWEKSAAAHLRAYRGEPAEDVTLSVLANRAATVATVPAGASGNA